MKFKHFRDLADRDLLKWYILYTIKRFPLRIYMTIKYIVSFLKPQHIQMRNIEEIRDKHRDGTIFIIGSGPSLDTYPEDFLEDKKSMTLHLAYNKFSNPTYAHITEIDRIKWFLENKPEIVNTQLLMCNPLFPLANPSYLLKDFTKKPPYFLSYIPKRLHVKKVENLVKAALVGKRLRYSANATCLHNGIWCAIILGFREINLIGCDHQNNQEKDYCSSAIVIDTRNRSRDFFNDAYHRMRITTDKIIDVCRKYDIKINVITNFEDFLNSEQ